MRFFLLFYTTGAVLPQMFWFADSSKCRPSCKWRGAKIECWPIQTVSFVGDRQHNASLVIGQQQTKQFFTIFSRFWGKNSLFYPSPRYHRKKHFEVKEGPVLRDREPGRENFHGDADFFHDPPSKEHAQRHVFWAQGFFTIFSAKAWKCRFYRFLSNQLFLSLKLKLNWRWQRGSNPRPAL